MLVVDQAGIEWARTLAKENNYSDSIQFITQDLNTLALPDGSDRFDVILAMIYMNDPRRDEGQSKLAFSLRDRLLKPEGFMIPSPVEYHAFACDWKSGLLTNKRKKLLPLIKKSLVLRLIRLVPKVSCSRFRTSGASSV